MCIIATVKIRDKTVTAPVLNPGDWFGKAWLVEVEAGNFSTFLVIEASTAQAALDELSDSEEYRHHVVVEGSDLEDYPEEDRSYSPSGRVVDYTHVMVYGDENAPTPCPCRYHFPPDGISPIEYYDFTD